MALVILDRLALGIDQDGINKPSRRSPSASATTWATPVHGGRRLCQGSCAPRSPRFLGVALIEASQKPSSLGAIASSLAGAHTSPQGDFAISVPRSSSSTSIQLAYRSHLGDATPAATRTLTLQVPASIHLTVSPHVTSVGRMI